MRSDVIDERESTLGLMRRTRRLTRAALEPLDPEAVIGDGDDGWMVRDVIGHLGVWNGEAAKALEAHAFGETYTVLDAARRYDDYNATATKERRAWPMERVWAEYDETHARFEAAVESMPTDRWDVPVVYPWTEVGSIPGLVVLMTEHETADHCEPILDMLR
jgi:hypothetical protein